MKDTANQQGLALFIALVVMAILLLITFSIAMIAFRELVITGAGLDSQKAIYAAMSGAECALMHEKNLSFIIDNSPACGDEEFTWDKDTNKFSLTGLLIDPNDGNGNGPCADIEVEMKTENEEMREVKRVISHGYNNCQNQTVQRTEIVNIAEVKEGEDENDNNGD